MVSQPDQPGPDRLGGWVRPERPQRPTEHPDWNALHTMFDDLKKQVGRTKEIQQKIFQLTGTAWSADRMIKVVVGPRGQLVELEIDPRVYRQPNSKALAATILETSRRAVEDVAAQAEKIINEGVPSDLRIAKAGSFATERLLRSHDADLPKVTEEDDD